MGIFDDIPEANPKLPTPLAVPTGLSDEADARRYLAQKFNSGFHCSRCDGYWEEKLPACPACPKDYWGRAGRAAPSRAPWRKPWQG